MRELGFVYAGTVKYRHLYYESMDERGHAFLYTGGCGPDGNSFDKNIHSF